MHVSVKALLGLLLVAFGAGVFFPSYFPETGLVTATSPSYSSSFSGIQTAFCPSPTCVSLTVSALDTAKSRVWVAMYSFTNDTLAQALIRAEERGVDVKVILESQQAGSKYSKHPGLMQAGIPLKFDSNPQLMHNKFAVVDSDWVITGSMNWTQNGVNENNENVNVINSNEMNSAFAAEFKRIWGDGIAVTTGG